MMTLKGRIALVTGGTRGIGLEIARMLLANGMKVAIMGSTKTNMVNAINELSTNNKSCYGVLCDIKSEKSISKAIAKVVDQFNGIDVVINCAGILDTQSVEDIAQIEWNSVINTNLNGAYFIIQKSLKYLEQSKFPRIVNISSNAGRMGGYENGMAYTASKGGLIALTYGLARRLANKGITVNCVAPGPIRTEMSSRHNKEALSKLLDRIPIGRMGEPQEVASAVLYLVSEEASFTTGAVIDVNGGLFTG